MNPMSWVFVGLAGLVAFILWLGLALMVARVCGANGKDEDNGDTEILTKAPGTMSPGVYRMRTQRDGVTEVEIVEIVEGQNGILYLSRPKDLVASWSPLSAQPDAEFIFIGAKEDR